MGTDELFLNFDSSWSMVDYDVDLYRGEIEGDPDQTPQERKNELISSLRRLAKDAAALADALELVDAAEQAARDTEPAPPTVSDMRQIFGEPVEGRDYDVMPSQDAKAKSVGEIEREIAIEAGDDPEDGEL